MSKSSPQHSCCGSPFLPSLSVSRLDCWSRVFPTPPRAQELCYSQYPTTLHPTFNNTKQIFNGAPNNIQRHCNRTHASSVPRAPSRNGAGAEETRLSPSQLREQGGPGSRGPDQRSAHQSTGPPALRRRRQSLDNVVYVTRKYCVLQFRAKPRPVILLKIET